MRPHRTHRPARKVCSYRTPPVRPKSAPRPYPPGLKVHCHALPPAGGRAGGQRLCVPQRHRSDLRPASLVIKPDRSKSAECLGEGARMLQYLRVRHLTSDERNFANPHAMGKKMALESVSLQSARERGQTELQQAHCGIASQMDGLARCQILPHTALHFANSTTEFWRHQLG